MEKLAVSICRSMCKCDEGAIEKEMKNTRKKAKHNEIIKNERKRTKNVSKFK